VGLSSWWAAAGPLDGGQGTIWEVAGAGGRWRAAAGELQWALEMGWVLYGGEGKIWEVAGAGVLWRAVAGELQWAVRWGEFWVDFEILGWKFSENGGKKMADAFSIHHSFRFFFFFFYKII